ncbi:MAG TPA: hypothetical protein V6C95_04110 [Coleofasciculaceae cyanobacterium]
MIYTSGYFNHLTYESFISMNHSAWIENLLGAVTLMGEEGRSAVDFLRKRRTKIGFRRARSNIGAQWTVFGNIRLNSHYYSYETPLDSLRIKTLIIHEARHLQQGMVTALSVYGELDAWQLEFGIYYRVKGEYPHPAVAELMSLPFGYDRAVLKKASQLMQRYAGKGYRIDLLPLFPLDKEIKYWFTR